MKIKSIDPLRIVVTSYPWPIVLVAIMIVPPVVPIARWLETGDNTWIGFGVISAAIPLFLLAKLGPKHLCLSLDRETNHVGMSLRKGLSKQSEGFALDTLLYATSLDQLDPDLLIKLKPADKGPYLPALVLVFSTDQGPKATLVPAWSNGNQPIYVANAINAWLSPPTVDPSPPKPIPSGSSVNACKPPDPQRMIPA